MNEQQKKGFSKLITYKVGALFMEAGTGKTRLAVELVNSVPNIDFVVWFAPYRTINTGKGIKSVKDEVEKWGGFSCKDVKYIGVESISSSDRIYNEIESKLRESQYPFIVIDESLKIKNIQAKRTKRLILLSKLAEYKLILNGTPITRNLLDLWAQMEFLSPKILGMTLQQFKDTFCEYKRVIKKDSGHTYIKEFITGYENIDYLFSKIKNYIYSCDLQLNVVQNYNNINYQVTKESRDKYNEIKSEFLKMEELIKWNNNIFLAMTVKLQMSYMLDENKIKEVKNIFKDIPQEKTIIFCRFVKSAEKCRKLFPKAQILSYQKESFGINLQEYNYTIYFDKCWDLSLRIQSGRRTFRTGQDNDCYYYDLTGNIGLDLMIDRNIDKKVSLSEYFKEKNIKEILKEL